MTHGWVRTWGASPHAPLEALEPVPSFADTTLRQAVRVSGGGHRVRVRFTNEYGTTPLVIGAAHVGLVTSGGDRPLTFSGRSDAVVPAGAPILSDPVDLPVPALAELAITLYLPEPVETPTCHAMGVQTSWASPGDSVSARATPLPLQAFLSAVEVAPDGPARTVVVIGDSITDGFGSTPNANRRWTDRLAERGGPTLHVSNQGISGNRVLNDGFGASVLARFDRDVVATPGLGHVVVSAGMNDIAISFAPRVDGPSAEFLKPFTGEPVTADDLIVSYRQLIARAHALGVPVHASTLAPWDGADLYSVEGESARQEVNAWIRTGGAFDGVLDFDAVWRDPARPDRIRDEFHEGDHQHGNDAGYRALADSIDLLLFEKGTSRA